MTDKELKNIEEQPKRSLAVFYQIAGWILFYYFWYRYFVVTAPGSTAFLLASVTTFFAALAVYLTIRTIIPMVQKKRRLAWIIAGAVLLVFTLTFGRTAGVMIIYRLLLKDRGIYFMGEFFTSLFHISYAFIFSSAVVLYREKYREQLNEEKEVKERLKTELAFLKNQVNPHFLFNVHNSIYFLINEDPGAAARAVLMLSEIMRYQLYECNAAAVLLEKELHNISNYIELEKIRIAKKIKIEYDFSGCDVQFRIAPFILLTLVENAFKHVLVFPGKANFIRVRATMQDNNFYLTVVNSMENNTGTPGEIPMGIGLRNLRRRLYLVYKETYDLRLTGREELFTADLKLPAL
jgi:sensor histidine kinase YesM